MNNSLISNENFKQYSEGRKNTYAVSIYSALIILEALCDNLLTEKIIDYLCYNYSELVNYVDTHEEELNKEIEKYFHNLFFK